jgi:glutamine amidotransferase
VRPATIAIVDYGSGNLRSAAKAFERVVREAGLGLNVAVTNNPDTVAAADRIVLPGVGAFADCMRGLTALPGMIQALEQAVLSDARPFLGICVGMQLLASTGREHGNHDGLGWIAGEVVPMHLTDPSMKIPHMGWNTLTLHGSDHPLFRGLDNGSHAYFVHSYRFESTASDHVLAHTEYGGEVAAVIGWDNIAGTQFHPEKSQHAGLQFIHNFLTWRI